MKIPVSDLAVSLQWYERALGAHRLADFDHFDDSGTRFAVILAVPGLEIPLELRWAPAAAPLMRGIDPIIFGASSEGDLKAWVAHLDAEGIPHSPVTAGGAGHVLVFADPDGTYLRVMDLPAAGIGAIAMTAGNPEPAGPWTYPEIMQHPTA